MADSGENWKELAAQKEREWKEVTELRMQTLEAAYKDKDKQLQEEKSKLQKLKEDFKYNLKLLEERDNELERYDATFSDLKANLNVKTAEISELKIKLDDMKSNESRDSQAREELQLHYQQRLKEKQAEIDQIRCNKDSEVQKERKEFENFKRNLQRQLTEVQDELDTQRRELATGFEDALKKREHEFRLQTDEMSAKVLEYELKAKLLSKELEIIRSAQEKSSHEYQQVEVNHRELEKLLKEKDWEIADTKAMKDARIADLEKQLQQSEVSMNRMKEDFQRKHAEMDRYGREKEAALAKVKEGYAEREQTLQQNIRQLQSQIEDHIVEKRKLQWALQDVQKEKDISIEKLQSEINDLKEKWGRHTVTLSKDQVTKDLELQALRENEDKLKSDILQRREDLERYKKELSLAAERENSLERSKTQLELDWQRRFEDLERQQYEKSEDLVKKLTRMRDEALATVKEKDRELQHRESLIRALHKDREQALATLRQHNITVDKNINVDIEKIWSLGNAEELRDLQQQNNSLKLVIKEMRMQMENLGQEIPVNEHSPRKEGSDSDYINSLEKELRTLRKKNRELSTAVDEGRKFGRIPPALPSINEDKVMSEVKDNGIIMTHIQSLNETIGALRTEKVDLSAQVKKQQAKILYLDSTVEKLTKEPMQKQIEVDQLQYEIGAQNRRYHAEVSGLRQQVMDLEGQLSEARKEADEYYKGNLERNMEVTTLSQQIAALKMDLAEKRPTLNFGAQELVIQQLRDEIARLRQNDKDTVESTMGVNINASPHELQQKLKTAVKHIAQLAKEKQHLIEMSNRLRADLKKAGVSPSGAPPRVIPPAMPSTNLSCGQSVNQHLSQEFLNKLNQLEKLQYQLTRQQLQYAQKFPAKKQVEIAESVDSEAEYRPSSILKKSTDFQSSDISGIDVEASQDLNNTQRSGMSYDSSREQSFNAASANYREQLLMSMSSVGGESLQEVWKILEEHRPTPTPRLVDRSGEDFVGHSTDSGRLLLQGKKPTMEQRVKPEKKLSNKSAGKISNRPSKNYKVRNYNVHQDVGVK